MGKGDIKTGKGKRARSTFGKTRTRSKKIRKFVATPAEKLVKPTPDTEEAKPKKKTATKKTAAKKPADSPKSIKAKKPSTTKSEKSKPAATKSKPANKKDE